MAGPLPAEVDRWRWAAASVIGTSHLKAGTRKQDAYKARVTENGTLCLAVSDGAGSASHGGEGASLVCRTLFGRLWPWFEANHDLPPDDTIREWVDEVRDRIAIAADRRTLVRRDFAATLTMLLVGRHDLLVAQVGDGTVVGRRGDEWGVLCWPENGEFASTTYFVTDDPEPRLNLFRSSEPYDGFAAFTDGIEHLALDHAARGAHPRFFAPMMRPVDQEPGSGKLANLSNALAGYLGGSAICERTDDDKTLILASRT